MNYKSGTTALEGVTEGTTKTTYQVWGQCVPAGQEPFWGEGWMNWDTNGGRGASMSMDFDNIDVAREVTALRNSDEQRIIVSPIDNSVRTWVYVVVMVRSVIETSREIVA